MKKTTYVASKDLQIDGITYAAGTPLATVETDIPLDRLVNGIGLGHVVECDESAGELAATRGGSDEEAVSLVRGLSAEKLPV